MVRRAPVFPSVDIVGAGVLMLSLILMTSSVPVSSVLPSLMLALIVMTSLVLGLLVLIETNKREPSVPEASELVPILLLVLESSLLESSLLESSLLEPSLLESSLLESSLLESLLLESSLLELRVRLSTLKNDSPVEIKWLAVGCDGSISTSLELST